MQNISINTPNWQPANLGWINRRFENLSPQELLRYGLVTYGDQIVLASGFGPSGIVLMHMVSRIRPTTAVFYLQTDLLFPETMALRDELAQRFKMTFTEIRADLSLEEQRKRYGPRLWESAPDLCCHLRKVEPLRRYLGGKRAWITGIRRDQSRTRANTPLLGWDSANNLVKLAPLAAWNREQVWDYIYAHDLPYNQLHDEGYPSIGCMPCTRAVSSEITDERAGRWAGTEKTECGIHLQLDKTLIRLS